MVDERSKSKVGIISGILVKLRNYFTTGLLVLAPTAVSIWILVQVFRWFDNILGRWYSQLFEYLSFDHAYTIPYIPGMGAVTLALIVILIGFFARQYVGRKFFNLWDKTINHVPLVNRIYIAVRQLSDSFAKGGGIIFKGSGFYQTDYRSKEYKEKAKAEAGESSSSSSTSDKKDKS